MSEEQIPLDFEGTDSEQQLRLRWAANAAKERAFWTLERRCLAWMQQVQPDDSDMRWWALQPEFKKRYWLSLHQRAKEEAVFKKTSIIPFADFEAAVIEHGEIIMRQDESLTDRFLSIIREDFAAGEPCSIDLSRVSNSQRWRSEACLREAIRRAGIPEVCLGIDIKKEGTA